MRWRRSGTRLTGRLGVCFATSGPGAIHLANGLLDARLEGVPLLAVTGMTYHDLVGTHYLQDFDTDYLYASLAAYNQRIMGPEHVQNVLDLACRTALANRVPVHLAFPIDFQAAAPADDVIRYKRNVPGHTTTAYAPPVRVTAVDQDGCGFVDDVGEGDLWFFPAGIPHSIQGLEDGCEFLLVFDSGGQMVMISHQTARLSAGRHLSPVHGTCVMELASMLAGEPFSDHPKSVCPMIGAFLRTYNDGVDAVRRQDLYWCAARVVGSSADEKVEEARVERTRALIAEIQQERGVLRRRLFGPRMPEGTPDAIATGAERILARMGDRGHRVALALVEDLVACGASGDCDHGEVPVHTAEADRPSAAHAGG